MRDFIARPSLSFATSMLLVASLGLTACSRPATEAPTAEPAAPAPEAARPMVAPEAAPQPEGAMPPAATEAPAAAPAAAAMTPAVNAGPPLATMSLASAPAKLGVPVDLRYSFDGVVEPGRPVTLHLAAVPRVAGSNLSVSIKQEAGIEAVAAPIAVQKAAVGAMYRRQLSVTRVAGGPSELRVLVTMEMPEGSAHSWFGVPFEPVAKTGKSVTVEQR
jgi:hypothetical protein